MTDDRPAEGFCGTAGCLAGHVVLAQGFRLERHRYRLRHPKTGETLRILDENYVARDNVAGVAAHYLGLNPDDACDLFDPDNTLASLKDQVDELCADPRRDLESKRRLRWAMDRVLDADAMGLWDQGNWISLDSSGDPQ